MMRCNQCRTQLSARRAQNKIKILEKNRDMFMSTNLTQLTVLALVVVVEGDGGGQEKKPKECQTVDHRSEMQGPCNQSITWGARSGGTKSPWSISWNHLQYLCDITTNAVQKHRARIVAA